MANLMSEVSFFLMLAHSVTLHPLERRWSAAVIQDMRSRHTLTDDLANELGALGEVALGAGYPGLGLEGLDDAGETIDQYLVVVNCRVAVTAGGAAAKSGRCLTGPCSSRRPTILQLAIINEVW